MVLLSSGPALADEFSNFGAGARAVGLAGAGASLLEDSYAVFANPAGMAFGDPGVSVGFVGAINRLQTRLSPRPAGYDLPDLGASSPAVPTRYRLSARGSDSRAPGFSGFTVGATVSLGIDWLRLGVLAFVPANGLGNQHTYYGDEREQYFSNSLHHTIYGERLSSQQTMVAGSVRPLRWLSIGAGIRLIMATRMNNQVFVPSQSDSSVQYLDMRTETTTATAPIASVAARTLKDKLRLSLTWRGEVQSSVKGNNVVQINGFQGTAQFPYSQPMAAVSEHLPKQVSFSAGYNGGPVTGTVDLVWSQWSKVRDDADQVAGFNDTWSISGGVEGRLAPRMTLRGGLGYRPSPVPDQTGRTNYVDNSMWIFGLGATQEFAVNGQTLEVSLFGQLQAAIPRTHSKSYSANAPDCAEGVKVVCDEVPDDTKQPSTGKPMPEAAGLQTGNPGFPGWSSGGWIAAAGVQLSWRYR